MFTTAAKADATKADRCARLKAYSTRAARLRHRNVIRAELLLMDERDADASPSRCPSDPNNATESDIKL